MMNPEGRKSLYGLKANLVVFCDEDPRRLGGLDLVGIRRLVRLPIFMTMHDTGILRDEDGDVQRPDARHCNLAPSAASAVSTYDACVALRIYMSL
eukprot:scaffold1516_cov230-Pinguiococcus_pyrenoidosus.AAC.10